MFEVVGGSGGPLNLRRWCGKGGETPRPLRLAPLRVIWATKRIPGSLLLNSGTTKEVGTVNLWRFVGFFLCLAHGFVRLLGLCKDEFHSCSVGRASEMWL